MKHKQTLSILIWAYRRKSSDIMATLYARVTVNGKRVDFSLSRRIEAASWDEKYGRMKGKSTKTVEINEYLDMVRGELRQCFYELRSTGKRITAEGIRNIFLGLRKIIRHYWKLFKSIMMK